MSYDGGPAFPLAMEGGFVNPGMSLRDWFAGQCAASLLAANPQGGSVEDLAVSAYRTADALIALR